MTSVYVLLFRCALIDANTTCPEQNPTHSASASSYVGLLPFHVDRFEAKRHLAPTDGQQPAGSSPLQIDSRALSFIRIWPGECGRRERKERRRERERERELTCVYGIQKCPGFRNFKMERAHYRYWHMYLSQLSWQVLTLAKYALLGYARTHLLL